MQHSHTYKQLLLPRRPKQLGENKTPCTGLDKNDICLSKSLVSMYFQDTLGLLLYRSRAFKCSIDLRSINVAQLGFFVTAT